VPTIDQRHRLEAVGTLRFAHPTGSGMKLVNQSRAS
jgi:hypothetical protein